MFASVSVTDQTLSYLQTPGPGKDASRLKREREDLLFVYIHDVHKSAMGKIVTVFGYRFFLDVFSIIYYISCFRIICQILWLTFFRMNVFLIIYREINLSLILHDRIEH